MSESSRVFVGVGSNLDSPLQQVLSGLEALSQLPQCRLLAASSLYRSVALGPANQPDYINAVALMETRLKPAELLEALQMIENGHGRVRQERWGPRTLDLDILLVDAQIIDLPVLQVPHPEIANRSFVLEPLYELWPEGQLPDGRLVSHLLKACEGPALERLAL
ncbi:2-amino-4-hydroxy-6-hydroxymethyldihydropteridine diphosphokinase [Hydrocarboniclastica marina]|uniref:2-amino-4-hydroxy-6-hydroxymethyldihydropteridine pyrophosphokinase n=1 Tax=Hydrocarboniclastica marina TaxID=2259620 RepID=A0A4P7XE86_9ALTE|nr:2-amino-4-hydroxy-6-hydroxymethyldihydropteridine diphosphokinase [Hydrocarboniclastica marina]QCF24915.1 2-amino-4-hydroxy-6-hydroxymethyldihydropteridine diphosphokinase [Hydrocarboniclastica marina]